MWHVIGPLSQQLQLIQSVVRWSWQVSEGILNNWMFHIMGVGCSIGITLSVMASSFFEAMTRDIPLQHRHRNVPSCDSHAAGHSYFNITTCLEGYNANNTAAIRDTCCFSLNIPPPVLSPRFHPAWRFYTWNQHYELAVVQVGGGNWVFFFYKMTDF